MVNTYRTGENPPMPDEPLTDEDLAKLELEADDDERYEQGGGRSGELRRLIGEVRRLRGLVCRHTPAQLEQDTAAILRAFEAEPEKQQDALRKLAEAMRRHGIKAEDLKEPFRSLLSTPPGKVS